MYRAFGAFGCASPRCDDFRKGPRRPDACMDGRIGYTTLRGEPDLRSAWCSRLSEPSVCEVQEPVPIPLREVMGPGADVVCDGLRGRRPVDLDDEGRIHRFPALP